MTKKHFQAFAEQISRDLTAWADPHASTAEYQRVYDSCLYAANAFADVAYQTNPRFDRDRFLAACGFGVKGGR